MSDKTLREIVITDADLKSVWNAQFTDLGMAQVDAIKAAIAAVVERHLADSADAPEGPWEEGFAPPHETVLARDRRGDLYQARVCYGMHEPFWCGHSRLNSGKILESEGITITHWMHRDALNRLDAQQKER